jgi:predicted acetyltransferase
MCDEYYDARMKAFWRAVAEDSEIELDEKEDAATERPIVIDSIELPKAKPKALLR